MCCVNKNSHSDSWGHGPVETAAYQNVKPFNSLFLLLHGVMVFCFTCLWTLWRVTVSSSAHCCLLTKRWRSSSPLNKKKCAQIRNMRHIKLKQIHPSLREWQIWSDAIAQSLPVVVWGLAASRSKNNQQTNLCYELFLHFWVPLKLHTGINL